MANFENKITINKPIKEVYQFLEDLTNHRALMPENVLDWTATPDTASFTIKNMTSLSIAVTDKKEQEYIIAKPTTKVPFELYFKWQLQGINDAITEAHFTIFADLNMMMKMIASTPLQKLVDHQINKLASILN